MLEMRMMFAQKKDKKKNDEMNERKYERKQEMLQIFDHQFTQLVLNKVKNITNKGISEVKPQLIRKGVCFFLVLLPKFNDKKKSFYLKYFVCIFVISP